ncbi:MAG: ABC transporter ATP-binding protein [Clostridia bacterium]|nr:ABC transporter ATP-binding protein [Clostridia bacterium]
MHGCLSLEHITKTYQDLNGETLAIKDFTHTFEEGKFVSVVGPSGCGKSTLLSIIAGLEPQTSGVIFWDNSKPLESNRNIGYMLQKDYLLDWRTVYKNVLLGLEIKKMLSPETIAYANSLLEKYDLLEFKDKYPSQLSGGMRQRVALIRTLATNPDILLLDEAFSALDYQTRLLVTDDVYKIIKAEGKTTIMVTHDIPESISMSDDVIVLSKRPTTIKQIYPIHFEMDNRTPLTCRDNPMFSTYFDRIWNALNSE